MPQNTLFNYFGKSPLSAKSTNKKKEVKNADKSLPLKKNCVENINGLVGLNDIDR